MRRKREVEGARVCVKGHIWNKLQSKQCMKCKIANTVDYNRSRRSKDRSSKPKRLQKRVLFVLPATDQRAIDFRTEAAKRGYVLVKCA
jgi:hypothetical protein